MPRVRRIIVVALLSGSLLSAIVGGVVTHVFAANSSSANYTGQAASSGVPISFVAQHLPGGQMVDGIRYTNQAAGISPQ